MADEQAVADQPDPESQETSADGGSAQDDDLDSLLNQWESSSAESAETGEQTDDDSDLDPKEIKRMRKELNEIREAQWQNETHQAVSEAVSVMRKSVADEMDVPSELWEDVLYGKAARDDRIRTAFMHRHKDPDKWNKTLASLAKQTVKGFKKDGVDKSATEDKNAVSSAVRSASKSPPADEGPSEKDFDNMSDAEFKKLMRQTM